MPSSRNCASSIAMTFAMGSICWLICAAESAGIASTVRPSWLEIE
jgi:hypothetical protein